jgi:hypothetical protein
VPSSARHVYCEAHPFIELQTVSACGRPAIRFTARRAESSAYTGVRIHAEGARSSDLQWEECGAAYLGHSDESGCRGGTCLHGGDLVLAPPRRPVVSFKRCTVIEAKQYALTCSRQTGPFFVRNSRLGLVGAEQGSFGMKTSRSAINDGRWQLALQFPDEYCSGDTTRCSCLASSGLRSALDTPTITHGPVPQRRPWRQISSSQDHLKAAKLIAKRLRLAGSDLGDFRTPTGARSPSPLQTGSF